MPRELIFNDGLWQRLLTGLAERGGGRRESGAFLLGHLAGERAEVTGLAFYDDLDPGCLTGGISFASEAYGRLWDLCAEQDVQVVGDAHTHPSRVVDQSALDQAHPMISMSGHVALIFPSFARGEIALRDIGLHDYLGNGNWHAVQGEEVAARITTGCARKRRRWWQLWRR